MIAVQLNKRDFEYDIHSLIRAFYPGVDVSIYQMGEEEPADYEKKLKVTYEEESISLLLTDAFGTVLAQETKHFPADTQRPKRKNILKKMLYAMLDRKSVV